LLFIFFALLQSQIVTVKKLTSSEQPLASAGFQCHAIQNRSKQKSKPVKVRNLGNEKREICKDSRQNSGHSIFSYAGHAEKFFTQIYRDLYGDAAMLVPIRMAPTWRPEINRNICH